MAGAAVMLVFAVAGAWLLTRSGEKVQVLTVTSPVVAGHAVTRADVGTVSVAGVPAAVPAHSLPEVVGKTATVDLLPGQILTQNMVTDDAVPGKGQALVGLALKPGQAPSGLAAGDTVTVLATVPKSNGGHGRSLSHPVVLAKVAQVYAVTTADTTTGGSLVTILVAASDSHRLTAYATAGGVSLVKIAPVASGGGG